MTTVAISVILSTYNAPAALAVSLQSFAQQKDRGFEVVVADDGSTRETADLVATAGRSFPVPLRHLWQDDIGFRPARARNLATAHSRGDYLLFVDGDCFVLPDFIACHRALAQHGHFVSGKRCWLRRPASRRCLAGGGRNRGRAQWFLRALAQQCTRPFEFLPLPDGRWRRRRSSDWRGVQTCNLGVWRRDVLAINGFDNRYVGHGWEDSDFALRLIGSGVRRKLGSHASPVLHLWHERRHRQLGPAGGNERLFQGTLAEGPVRAANGLREVAPTQPPEPTRSAPGKGARMDRRPRPV